MIREETLKELTAKYVGDSEMLDIICKALESFEEYHSAIYKMK